MNIASSCPFLPKYSSSTLRDHLNISTSVGVTSEATYNRDAAAGRQEEINMLRKMTIALAAVGFVAAMVAADTADARAGGFGGGGGFRGGGFGGGGFRGGGFAGGGMRGFGGGGFRAASIGGFRGGFVGRPGFASRAAFMGRPG